MGGLVFAAGREGLEALAELRRSRPCRRDAGFEELVKAAGSRAMDFRSSVCMAFEECSLEEAAGTSSVVWPAMWTGLAEVQQGFGQALVPEGILDGERQQGCSRWAQRRGERGEAGFEGERAFARVGETALRGDPQDAALRQQVDSRSPQEAGGAADGVEVDAEDADALEDAVPRPKRLGVHRSEVLALRQQAVREEDRDHRVPPGGVVGVDDDGACRLAARGSAPDWRCGRRVKVPPEVAADDAAEEGEDCGRDVGGVHEGLSFQLSVVYCLIPDEGLWAADAR